MVSAADRLATIDANFDQTERTGTAHLTRLAAEIRVLSLPRGSYVIVDVASGGYVTGLSRSSARDAFRARYPKGPGWACRIEDLPSA